MNTKNQAQLKIEEINDDSSISKYCGEKKNQKRKSIKSSVKVNRLRQRRRQRTRIKSEEWEYSQIHKIFTLYSQYGSQWKNMEGEFEQRSANSIKNRFYTVIRTFLKLLFRYHPSIINKLPHEIASKTILKFYQSREQFLKFHDFGKKTMRKLDYNINSNHLKSIVQQHRQQIQQIYNLIFKIKEREEKELPEPEDQIIKPKTQNQNIYSKRTKIEQNLCGNKAYEQNEENLQDSQGLIQPKVQVQPQTDLFSLGYSISSPSYIFFVPYTNFCQGTPQINYFQPRF